MSSDAYGLIELILVLGLVFGFAYTQLRSVRRDRPKDESDDKDRPPPSD
jgi:hypothetical protein